MKNGFCCVESNNWKGSLKFFFNDNEDVSSLFEVPIDAKFAAGAPTRCTAIVWKK